ncbi:hypothetical protein C1646_764493 [Rhizophagus diaphanus]|nr:hypothetical protein C1646_764493 [Rhizophagus diaphanus] [Rhizophagus sp. MUCL 43196]
MVENSICEYLPDTCYTCQKCLRCFKLLQENPYVNTKFGYNSNFEECFSYTTCNACNSSKL